MFKLLNFLSVTLCVFSRICEKPKNETGSISPYFWCEFNVSAYVQDLCTIQYEEITKWPWDIKNGFERTPWHFPNQILQKVSVNSSDLNETVHYTYNNYTINWSTINRNVSNVYTLHYSQTNKLLLKYKNETYQTFEVYFMPGSIDKDIDNMTVTVYLPFNVSSIEVKSMSIDYVHNNTVKFKTINNGMSQNPLFSVFFTIKCSENEKLCNTNCPTNEIPPDPSPSPNTDNDSNKPMIILGISGVIIYIIVIGRLVCTCYCSSNDPNINHTRRSSGRNYGSTSNYVFFSSSNNWTGNNDHHSKSHSSSHGGSHSGWDSGHHSGGSGGGHSGWDSGHHSGGSGGGHSGWDSGDHH